MNFGNMLINYKIKNKITTQIKLTIAEENFSFFYAVTIRIEIDTLDPF